ncbi:hypothetical protein ACFTXM_42245 [Streptomyces sp. NPDC056930]|uniref:hypothetical protein n=1 Tax=Streptomyces sp. NPDC056930 TaxID=3345967 RepID=UPI003624C3F5
MSTLKFDFEPNEAEHVAKSFVQLWPEAVIRQAARTRAIRRKSDTDSRSRGGLPGVD